LGLGRVKTALRDVDPGSQEAGQVQVAIAAIRGLIRTMFITRVSPERDGHLGGYFWERFGDEVCAPMRAFIAPNGCSLSRPGEWLVGLHQGVAAQPQAALMLPSGNPPFWPGRALRVLHDKTPC
jgi:hypothetical protein